jgi:hypothetical protein
VVDVDTRTGPTGGDTGAKIANNGLLFGAAVASEGK